MSPVTRDDVYPPDATLRLEDFASEWEQLHDEQMRKGRYAAAYDTRRVLDHLRAAQLIVEARTASEAA